MSRILVTGSRPWTDRDRMRAVLLEHGPGVVVHGGARGADRIAAELAVELGWPDPESHPVPDAEWKRVGKSAGHRRNQRMVDLGADVCLAFPTAESRGTWDCAARARRAWIPVVFTLGEGLTEANIGPSMRAAEARL